MRSLLRTTLSGMALAAALAMVPSQVEAGGWQNKHCKHCGPGGYGYGSYYGYGYGPGWHWSAYTTCVGNWCGFMYPSRPEPVWGPSWHGLYYPVGPGPGMTPYGYVAPAGGTDVLAGRTDVNESATIAQRNNGGAANVAAYPPQPVNNAAMLYVTAPAGARVFVDGQAVNTLDASKPFVISDFKAGEGRDVELRAEIDRNGKVVSQSRTLPVVAGESMTIVVDLGTSEATAATADADTSTQSTRK